jgi:tetratricopeptide (TPR) repeat protein
MDRRASLVLALGLAAGVLGCTPRGSLPVVSGDAQTAPAPAPPEMVDQLPVGDGKPHKPHASTFVAAGRLAENTAEDPKRPLANREDLLEQARKAYQQAIATDADYVPAYQALAGLYLKQRDYDRAVATYQKVLKGHPKEAVLWFELGMCYSRQRQWDQALANLRQAVALDPENRPYVNTLGFCLARAGKADESVACFAKVVGPAQAHYNVARMLHHLKQDKLCREHLQQALQVDPRLTGAKQLLDQLDGKAAPGVVRVTGIEPADDDAEEEETPGR